MSWTPDVWKAFIDNILTALFALPYMLLMLALVEYSDEPEPTPDDKWKWYKDPPIVFFCSLPFLITGLCGMFLLLH